MVRRIQTGHLYTYAFSMIIALVLAWDPQRKVLDLVAYAWAGFGAAFGYTVMARISLLTGRMRFLGDDWLGRFF